MWSKSTLRLGFVIMSSEGRFFIGDGNWGSVDGNDMYDAQVYSSRRQAIKVLAKLGQEGTVFEIGVYNGKPVMLVDAYEYWLDAKYSALREK